MRYLKMLGMAAVAALASMAFLGAGTASADVACEENVGEHNECPEPITSGLVVGLTLEGAPAILLTGNLSNTMQCHSKALGEILENLGSHEGLKALIKTLSFTGCSGLCKKATEVLLPAILLLFGLELHAIIDSDREDGLLPGALLSECTFGITCEYKLAATGERARLLLVAGDTLKADHVPLVKGHGSILCPSSAQWDATYLLTLDDEGKKPVYLAALP